MPDTLVCEVFTDADPCPRVGITISNLDPTTPSLISLHRTADGIREGVRGWVEKRVTGSDFAWDYEVPLGRAVTYELELVSGPTVPPDDRPTVFVDSPTGWVQDPLAPSLSVQISGGDPTSGAPELMPTAFKGLSYRVETSLMVPMGGRLPIAVAGARLAASGVTWDSMTSAAEHTTLLRNILMEAYPVLVRPLPSYGPLPPLCYLSVEEVQEIPVNHALGGQLTRWGLRGDLVSSPALSIIVPVWTYADIEEMWASYSEAQIAASAAGSTYLDQLRDPGFGA